MSGDRIGAARDLAAAFADDARQRVGGAGAVEPHGLALEPGEIALERGRLAHIGDSSSACAHCIVELAAVDIERRAAFARQIAKASASGVWATSPPRMLKVQATVCGSDTSSASARAFASSARMRLILSAALSPAYSDVMQHDWPGWRRGPVAPQRVDRVGVTGTSDAPAASQAFGELFRIVGGVQPGVVAELGAGLADWPRAIVPAGSRPGARCRTSRCRSAPRPARCSGRRRTIRRGPQHDGRAGRAGEAGQPGEPLFARRHIFVLMAVGARHHEPVEAALL